jgi:hypothetical protein
MPIRRESIRHAAGRVLGLLDGKHEADGAAEEDDQAEPAAQRLGDAGGHAQPGAEHGGQQAQGQQPVGIAQHLVALGLRGGKAIAGSGRQGSHAIVH